jgi:hypothetical protein
MLKNMLASLLETELGADPDAPPTMTPRLWAEDDSAGG